MKDFFKKNILMVLIMIYLDFFFLTVYFFYFSRRFYWRISRIGIYNIFYCYIINNIFLIILGSFSYIEELPLIDFILFINSSMLILVLINWSNLSFILLDKLFIWLISFWLKDIYYIYNQNNNHNNCLNDYYISY